jgi:hypothetical protein
VIFSIKIVGTSSSSCSGCSSVEQLRLRAIASSEKTRVRIPSDPYAHHKQNAEMRCREGESQMNKFMALLQNLLIELFIEGRKMYRDTKCRHCERWMARLTDHSHDCFCGIDCKSGYYRSQGKELPASLIFFEKRQQAIGMLWWPRQDMARIDENNPMIRTLDHWRMQIGVRANENSVWRWLSVQVKTQAGGASVFRSKEDGGGVNWKMVEEIRENCPLIKVLKKIYGLFWELHPDDAG